MPKDTPRDTKADPPAPGLSPGAPSAAGSMVSPLDIQQKEFRVSRFGGYRMRDVDEFLDRLTDTMSALTAENERLRRGAPGAPILGTPDLDEVARQADEIIQRARDEAARITAEANERAAGVAGIAATSGATDDQRAAVGAFLSQERAFLQSLAALVQEHAETVKGMARRPRPERISSEPATPSPPESPTRQGAPPSKGAGTPTSAQAATAGATPPGATAPPRGVAPPQAPAPAPAPSDRAMSKGASAPTPPRSRDERPAADDDTQVLGRDDPIVVEEPQPTGSRRDEREVPGGDPTLRELFWGEDG